MPCHRGGKADLCTIVDGTEKTGSCKLLKKVKV